MQLVLKPVKDVVIDGIWEEVASDMNDWAFHRVWAYVGRRINDNGGRMVSSVRRTLENEIGIVE